MEKKIFEKLLNDYLSGDLETLKEKYRQFYLNEGTKVFLNEEVWVDRMKLSVIFKEKLLEKGIDEKEYMEMNGRLLREKDPDFNISINKTDDLITDDKDDIERVIIVESSKELAKCLEDEGYRIWHKPYFAMPGYTHSKWTVKPDKKEALDAAKNDLKAITAEEFIKTFG